MRSLSKHLSSPSGFREFRAQSQRVLEVVTSKPYLLNAIKPKEFSGLQLVDFFKDQIYFKYQSLGQMVAIQCSSHFCTTSFKMICYIDKSEERQGGITYCKKILIKKVFDWEKYNLWVVIDGTTQQLAAVRYIK